MSEDDQAPEPQLLYLPWYGYIVKPRWLWQIVSGVAALLLLPPLALYLFLQWFDADTFRPRIATALRQALGRQVDILGPVTMAGVLNPRFSFGPVAISNGAASGPAEFARIGRVELDLALWPLLSGRAVVQRALLDAPDIRLDRDPDGRGSWQDARVGTAGTPKDQARDGAESLLALQSLTLRNGRITWRDRQRGSTASIGLPRVLVAVRDDGTLAISTDATIGRDRFAILGETGTLARLMRADDTTPWPIRLSAQTRGASISAKGSFTQPLRAAGYTLQLDMDMRESRNFRSLLPDAMPPLRNIRLAAQLTDVGRTFPDIGTVALTVGASDISGLLPGGRLERLELRAGGMDATLHGEVKGVVGGAPLQLAAVLGTPRGVLLAAGKLGAIPAWWLDDMPAGNIGFPIDIAAALGDSEFSATGALAAPARLAGLDLRVATSLRNVRKLEPVMRQRLPSWDFATLRAEVADAPGGLLNGIGLRNLLLNTPDGDVAGIATLLFAKRLRVQAQLTGKRLDFDGLAASFSALHFGAAPPIRSTDPPSLRSAPLYFNQRPFALGGFDLIDVDMQLKLAEARLFGLPYRNLDARALLRDAALRVDGAMVQTPGGPVQVDFSYDTRAPTPPMRLRVAAAGQSIKPILLALQRPEDISGNLAVDMDLTGEGRDAHALASSLRGHLRLALVDGEIDTTMFTATMYAILRQAKLPMHLLSAGAAQARCFALAMTAERGEILVDHLVLDSERLLIQATGGIQGERELVDLQIRPQLRFGGPALAMPLRYAGSFAGARLLIDLGADAPNRPSDPFRVAARTIEAGADPCPAALTAARGGTAGPLPKTPPFKVTPIALPKTEE